MREFDAVARYNYGFITVLELPSRQREKLSDNGQQIPAMANG